jgi:MOSC domain-containing protein YiiM
MVSHGSLTAHAGRGLEGDRYALGVGRYSDERPGRHLTLIAIEEIDAANASLAMPLAPDEARRNIVTRGIDLPALIGRRFRIGQVECVAVRHCPPCTYLDGLLGREVLDALHERGGIRADILAGGIIRVGDAIEVADGPEAPDVSSA